ncbi:uncharacterized protein LOC135485147 isoform X2 [Lineus longissimus]|uniref:uncharacterized protein LOC135485147 isoform X2 n=1 Tax=Lineus longissimus TaxID=88925 RepID=UPI00315DBB73
MANLIQKFRKWRKEHKKEKQKQQSSRGFIRQLFRSQRGRYSSVKMSKEQKNFEFQELNPGDNASLCSDVHIMDPHFELAHHDATDVDCTVEKSDCVHYHVMDLNAVETGDHGDMCTRSPSPEEVSQGDEPKDPLDNSDYYTKRAEEVGNCDSNSMECLDVYFKPTESRKSFRRSMKRSPEPVRLPSLRRKGVSKED